jgi:hypothetical protein
MFDCVAVNVGIREGAKLGKRDGKRLGEAVHQPTPSR